MSGLRKDHGRRTAIGTIYGLVSQFLIIPTGVITAAYLTRKLGPELYGLLIVTASIILWVQLSITLMFSRTTVKFVAEAEDWREVATTLVRTQFFFSLAAWAMVVLVAPLLARLLGSPELTGYIRLYSLDLPIQALAAAHRATLIGKGAYGRRALATASRWLSRMVLVLILVGLGLSVNGAILGAIGASLVSLLVARHYVKPPLFRRSSFPVRRLWSYVVPLFFFDIGIHLFTRLDLLMVKAIGESPAAAGYYGAAQNMTIVTGLLSVAFTPLILSSVTAMIRQGLREKAREMVLEAMRIFICTLPFAGVVAGSSRELVELVYGSNFLSSGPLAEVLVFAAMAMVMLALCTAVLIAEGRPGWTVALMTPLVVMAFIAHLLVVPRFGSMGAAWVTTSLSGLGVVMAFLAVRRQTGVSPPLLSIFRAGITTLMVFYLCRLWPTPGLLVAVKGMVMSAVALLSLILSRELTRLDLDFIRSLAKR